jgi:hypothetical protein
MKRNVKNVLLISGLILSIIIVCAYYLTYSLIKNKIIQVENNLKEQGYVLTYSKQVFSLNPFNLHITLQNPTFKDRFGLIEWKGEELSVSINPWDYYTLWVASDGKQSLSFLQNTHIPLGVLDLEGLKASFSVTSQGQLDRVGLSITRLESEVEKKKQPISLSSIDVRASNLSKPLDLQLYVRADFLGFETFLTKKPTQKEMQFEANIDLTGYAKPIPPLSLAEWRDGGGVIDVKSVSIKWPPINFVANGTLTLDNEMYPLGSFTSHIKGSTEILGYMVELGYIKEKDASAATFVLDLFSKPDEQGQRQLTVPITLQNKRLSIGPASLMKLQPVEGL